MKNSLKGFGRFLMGFVGCAAALQVACLEAVKGGAAPYAGLTAGLGKLSVLDQDTHRCYHRNMVAFGGFVGVQLPVTPAFGLGGEVELLRLPSVAHYRNPATGALLCKSRTPLQLGLFAMPAFRVRPGFELLGLIGVSFSKYRGQDQTGAMANPHCQKRVRAFVLGGGVQARLATLGSGTILKGRLTARYAFERSFQHDLGARVASFKVHHPLTVLGALVVTF